VRMENTIVATMMDVDTEDTGSQVQAENDQKGRNANE
jgi:hypothetical protein